MKKGWVQKRKTFGVSQFGCDVKLLLDGRRAVPPVVKLRGYSGVFLHNLFSHNLEVLANGVRDYDAQGLFWGENRSLVSSPKEEERKERKEKNRVKGIHGTMRVALSSITESWAR